MSQKTRDGLKLRKIIRVLEALAGVSIRQGSNHPYVAYRQGYSVPCPVAASTDAKRMIVPWIKQATGYQNSNEIYNALRNGGWN